MRVLPSSYRLQPASLLKKVCHRSIMVHVTAPRVGRRGVGARRCRPSVHRVSGPALSFSDVKGSPTRNARHIQPRSEIKPEASGGKQGKMTVAITGELTRCCVVHIELQCDLRALGILLSTELC